MPDLTCVSAAARGVVPFFTFGAIPLQTAADILALSFVALSRPDFEIAASALQHESIDALVTTVVVTGGTCVGTGAGAVVTGAGALGTGAAAESAVVAEASSFLAQPARRMPAEASATNTDRRVVMRLMNDLLPKGTALRLATGDRALPTVCGPGGFSAKMALESRG